MSRFLHFFLLFSGICLIFFGLPDGRAFPQSPPPFPPMDTISGKFDVPLPPGFPQPKHGSTYLIAHRGAHDGIPENSLAAYKKAIDLGCDFIEVDVRTTSDAVLVSIHNATVDAYVTGQTGKVKAMTFADLRALDIGAKYGDAWKNTRIPSLDEVFQLCKGKIGIYLDLKEALVADIVRIVKKYEMQRQVVWYIPASKGVIIRELQAICPDCLPMPDPGPPENILHVMRDFKPYVLASDMGTITNSFVQLSHESGALVFVDERADNLDLLKEEWSKMLCWKVDGIQTDDPARVIDFIVKGQ